jgi:uncharacterized protein with von Willebrand factor type A (vWA) domain
MFIDFFFKVKAAKIPATIREYLVLIEALQKHVVEMSVEEFYFLSRTALVKDEKHFDRYDRVFGEHFKGIENLFKVLLAEIDPVELMRRQAELLFSEDDRQAVEAKGGWAALVKEMQRRLEAQRGGAPERWRENAAADRQDYGNRELPRPGPGDLQQQPRDRLRRAKIWEKRDFRNYDDTLQLGIRNVQLALRRLREFARLGVEDELDLDRTIRNTALDIVMRPEEKNRVKVLMLFDVGGSMDDHIRLCEELFSAARNEFKHLEFFYFHNCVYDSLWRDNERRHDRKTATTQVINTFPKDYKLIFVGDAFMSTYEITHPDGSVEHVNEEAGDVWLNRLLDHWGHAIWLNPRPEDRWINTPSTMLIKEIMLDRMFPLSIDGLTRGLRALRQ